ncbi:hypothetical protein [Rickettsia endosymbiont of Urophora cardui]|uniref:hypothetical protein n=1 Tax=Rickettsia endosymbiont of Urophora cardui TaxID=3066265 RepID=UPI00313BA179
MNISHYPSDSNRATLVAAHVANQSQYITPDYFLPTGHSESYYSKQYSGNHTTNTINHHHAANTIAGIRPIYQSKSSKISRVASVMLLSFGFLATAVEVRAQPSLGTSTPTSSFAVQSPLQQQVRFQSSQQQPKKKSLLTRAAHKTAKRLGFSSGKPNSNTSTSPYTQTTESPYHKQAEISMEEWKELYTAEYGESMDATIGRGATGGDKTSGLAEALRKSLALREKILESRRAEDIFSKESIYSKPIDAISIASSSTQYEEPWQDPDALIGEAFEIEFSTSKKQQRFEPSAPPLSAYSSFSSGERIERRDIKLRQEELEAIELIDQAIEDSGYSNSISNSPTNEVGFRGGDDTDISNCLSSDTSSTEYDRSFALSKIVY